MRVSVNGEVNPWVSAAAASLGTGGLMGLIFKFLVTSWIKVEEEFKAKTKHDLNLLMLANTRLELRLESLKLIDLRLANVDERVKIDHNRLSRVEDVAEKVRWIVESRRGIGTRPGGTEDH